MLIKDINPGTANGFVTPGSAKNVRGKLFFGGNEGIRGWELWQTDGTEEGTSLVEDIWPGSEGSRPRALSNVSGTLFFAADDGTHGQELWKSVIIGDTEPPAVSCTVAAPLLWPPNHGLVTVGLGVSVTDDSDPNPLVQVSIFGNDGADSSDAAEVAPNTLRLRAERSGNGDGRVYLIVVTATDSAGNVGFEICTVVVPHDQSPAAIASVNAQAAAAAEFYRVSQAPPPGYILIGQGP